MRAELLPGGKEYLEGNWPVKSQGMLRGLVAYRFWNVTGRV